MKQFYSLLLISCFSCVLLNAQKNFPPEIQKQLHKVLSKTRGKSAQMRWEPCDYDYTLTYSFENAPDSFLTGKTVFKRYGNTKVAEYVYESEEAGQPPALISIDSSVFDAQERLIYRETLDSDVTGNFITSFRGFYYPHGNQSSEVDSSITFNLDFNTSQLLPYEKIVNTFNANDDFSEQLIYRWESSVQSWEKADRYTYSYNAPGELDEQLHYLWDGSVWVLFQTTDYIYENGVLKESQTTGNFGIPVEKTVYTNGPNQVGFIFYVWNDGSDEWEKSFAYLLANDDEGKPEFLDFTVVFFGQEVTQRVQYDYFPGEDCWFKDDALLLDPLSQQYILVQRTYYYPKLTNGVSGSEVSSEFLEVSPNPALEGSFVVKSTPDMPLQLFDVTGKLVWSGTSTGADRIQLPAGLSGIFTLRSGFAAVKLVVR